MARSRARFAAALAAQAPLEADASRDARDVGPHLQLLLPLEDVTGRDPSGPRRRPTGGKGTSARKTPPKAPRRPRRILAIDPGTRICGWAIIDTAGETLVDSGVIEAKGKTLPDRLPALRAGLTALVPRADLIVYEAPFRTGNMGDQALPQVVAILQLAAADLKIPVKAIYLSSARKLVTGAGNTTKEDVAELLRVTFWRELHARGRDWTTHDESDAACIGLAAAIQTREAAK